MKGEEIEYRLFSLLQKIDSELEEEALKNYGIYEDGEEQSLFDTVADRLIDYLLERVRECQVDEYSKEVITYNLVKAISILNTVANRFYEITKSKFIQEVWRGWGKRRIVRLENWYRRNMAQARILIEEAISVAERERCGMDFGSLFDFLSVVEYVARTALNLVRG